jgi:hypothetical protein
MLGFICRFINTFGRLDKEGYKRLVSFISVGSPPPAFATSYARYRALYFFALKKRSLWDIPDTADGCFYISSQYICQHS